MIQPKIWKKQLLLQKWLSTISNSWQMYIILWYILSYPQVCSPPPHTHIYTHTAKSDLRKAVPQRLCLCVAIFDKSRPRDYRCAELYSTSSVFIKINDWRVNLGLSTRVQTGCRRTVVADPETNLVYRFQEAQDVWEGIQHKGRKARERTGKEREGG